MKKLICCVLIIFTFVGCLTACTFSQNMSGGFAGEATSSSEVAEMLTALKENRISDAEKLLHPQVSQNPDVALTQMSTFLVGKEVDSIDVANINVNKTTGTGNKTRTEQVAYQVKFVDGDSIYLNVVYLSDEEGAGFISFQIVLGLV